MTIDVDVRIGLALYSVRSARGMTQAKVAKRAGLSVSFLSDVENGKRGLSVLSLGGVEGDSLDPPPRPRHDVRTQEGDPPHGPVATP